MVPTRAAPVPPDSPPITRDVQRDAGTRVAGTFPFAVDRRVTGTVHVSVVRSGVAHGRLTGVDAGEALALPGVLAVIDGPSVFADLGERMFHGENRQDQPVLAVDRVRYMGEPVALVVAETRHAAETAARTVYPDIEELPFVVDQDEAALSGAPQLHDAWPENFCGRFQLVHGDAERAMATAVHTHTETYRSPTQNHAAMEPHVATASWPAADRLEVWTGTQAPWEVGRRLAGIFGLAPDAVRVRGDNIGGGFGSKLDLKLEAMVAVAARVVGRPARLELTRDEVFVTAARHAATVTITTGADANGDLVARIIDIVYNGGAYALSTPRSIRSGMIRSPGPYHTPNVLVTATGRYTNTVPTGPFRGAMTGQVCWAHERSLDELAAMIGMDPLELRDRNVLRDGDVYATGETMHDMRYRELVAAAAAGVDWSSTVPATRPGLARGKGIAVVLKSTRTPSRSEAAVTVDRDGRVTVHTSSVEMGQGAHLTMSEMAARRLGLPASAVRVSVVDTAATPFDTVTSSSRTTLMMGLAVERAALDLRAKLDDAATTVLGAGPFDHRDACLHGPGGSVSYRDLVASTGLVALRGAGVYETPPGYGRLDPETSQGLHTVSWHQGAVAVEVEVDTGTGRVRVLRMHGASFAGRAIDRERIRKQTEGGMIFGLGLALMEEMVFDSGELANGNFSDYQLPSIMDIPVDIGSTVLADDDPEATPHGVGENSVPPVAPAIGNAIFAATGARLRELPMTAERVLRAIRAAGEGER
jgi:CO/xanthine dehydrogenase Mo-binding subunit